MDTDPPAPSSFSLNLSSLNSHEQHRTLSLDQLAHISGSKWQKPSKKTGAGPLVKIQELTELGFLPYLSENKDFGKTQSVDCWVRRLECVLK